MSGTVLEFHALPWWATGGLFLAAAVVVWVAGTRVAKDADLVARRYRFTSALVGMVLLGVVTSLPEIATTTSAARLGNGALAANNLLGGLALQMALLAVVDASGGGGTLQRLQGNPTALLQGSLLVLLLSLTAAAITVGDEVGIFGVGAWSAVLVVTYLAAVALVRLRQKEGPRPIEGPSAGPEGEPGSSTRLLLSIAASSLAILVAGYVLARTGDTLAHTTTLGSAFVGGFLVAFATSLPELSTVTAAVRTGNVTLAVSNLLGTNLLEVGLLFVADLFYREGPILATLGGFSLFACAWAIAITVTFMIGLLVPAKRPYLRLTPTTVVLVLLYLGGAAILYGLR